MRAGHDTAGDMLLALSSWVTSSFKFADGKLDQYPALLDGTLPHRIADGIKVTLQGKYLGHEGLVYTATLLAWWRLHGKNAVRLSEDSGRHDETKLWNSFAAVVAGSGMGKSRFLYELVQQTLTYAKCDTWLNTVDELPWGWLDNLRAHFNAYYRNRQDSATYAHRSVLRPLPRDGGSDDEDEAIVIGVSFDGDTKVTPTELADQATPPIGTMIAARVVRALVRRHLKELGKSYDAVDLGLVYTWMERRSTQGCRMGTAQALALVRRLVGGNRQVLLLIDDAGGTRFVGPDFYSAVLAEVDSMLAKPRDAVCMTVQSGQRQGGGLWSARTFVPLRFRELDPRVVAGYAITLVNTQAARLDTLVTVLVRFVSGHWASVMAAVEFLKSGSGPVSFQELLKQAVQVWGPRATTLPLTLFRDAYVSKEVDETATTTALIEQSVLVRLRTAQTANVERRFVLQLSGLAQWQWARSQLELPDPHRIGPVERCVATKLHAAIGQLLACQPCDGSMFEGFVAEYCNVARCLLPIWRYSFKTIGLLLDPVLVATTTYHEMFLARAGRGATYVAQTTDPARVEAITTKAWGTHGLDYVVVGDPEYLRGKLALEFSGVAQGNPYGTIVQTQSIDDAKTWCTRVHRHDSGTTVQPGLDVSCFGATEHGRVQPLAFECRFSAEGNQNYLSQNQVFHKLKLFAGLYPDDAGTWLRCGSNPCHSHECTLWYCAKRWPCVRTSGLHVHQLPRGFRHRRRGSCV